MNPYVPLKAAWHLDRIEELRETGTTRPVTIQLILSDLCNHDCHFCSYRSSEGLSSALFPDADGNHNPNRMIPVEKAREIIDDAAVLGVRAITFTGGGEPTVHPHHLELMQRALDLGIEGSLNTNGVLLRDGWEDVFPRLTYARVSVDAGNAEEYARIRGVAPSHYERALGNLRRMVEACPDTFIGTGYVVTPENYPHLEEGVRNIRDTGARYVRLAAMQSTRDVAAYEGEWETARSAAESVRSLSTDDFEVINLLDTTMDLTRPDYRICGFQHVVVYIGADLTTYRCCYTAYTEIGDAGSLKDCTLQEWFHSAERRASYRAFDARSCERCPLNEKNRVLAYLLDPEPMHVNFP